MVIASSANNEVQASDLLSINKFKGNTKIQGDILDNTCIVVINGRLDIEGSVGNKVAIELRFTKSTDNHASSFDVYIKGDTGIECNIKISRYIRGNVTIAGKLGNNSLVKVKGLVEAKSIGEGCKLPQRINFIGGDITKAKDMQANDNLADYKESSQT